MGSQAGPQGGRRLTDAKPPVKEGQGDAMPATMVTPPVDEKHDHQHTQDATCEYLGSLQPKVTKSDSVSISVRAGCTKAASNIDSRNICHEPPVTKATLSELDVPRIIFNPKLRHDVNFDPDLHFRPNLDGEKGRRKTQKQNEFWDCLRAQLEAFMGDQSKFILDLGGKKWCLPITLHAIGEILATLVPPEDRSVVEEILNVDLLMQQFSKGVADLEKLALWLSRTLKSHCAPMRDEWVDEMVKQLSNGNLNRDITLLVQGLQTLLAILESMKLDVANHQIRCLRPLLIQDTIEFEQTYFMKKIATRKIDVRAAYNFFKAAERMQDHLAGRPRGSPGDAWIFFKAFANILRPSSAAFKVPDTFVFDEERIIKLRSAILDAVNLDVCIRLFRLECQRSHSPSTTPLNTPSTTPSTPSLLWDSATCSSRSSSPTSRSSLTSPTLMQFSDLQDVFINSEAFHGTCRQTELPQLLGHSSLPYDECKEVQSPSVPLNMTGPVPSASAPITISQPWGLPLESSESSIRQSILALIDDMSGESRWQQSCPAIALQILRSTHNLNSFTAFESRLRFHLSNFTSDLFQTSESSVLADLYPHLDDLVTQYNQLSSTQLFEINSIPPKLPSTQPSCRTALRDVAKQIAHIGILHWRVWAPLVYLVNPDTEEPAARAGDRTSTGTSENGSQRRARHSSSTVGDGRRMNSSGRQNSVSEIPARTLSQS